MGYFASLSMTRDLGECGKSAPTQSSLIREGIVCEWVKNLFPRPCGESGFSGECSEAELVRWRKAENFPPPRIIQDRSSVRDQKHIPSPCRESGFLGECSESELVRWRKAENFSPPRIIQDRSRVRGEKFIPSSLEGEE